MKIFSVDTCRLIVFITLLVKIFAYIYFSGASGLVGGDNDANYYDEYALGHVDNAVNFWPILLRIFADIGIYSRQWVSVALFVLSSLFIPFVFSKIIVRQLHLRWFSTRIFWNSFLLVILYPTVLFYSFDIYRDVMMYIAFLVAIYFLSEHLLLKKTVLISRYLLLFFIFSYISYLLRDYLGIALFISFLVTPLVKIKKWFYSYIFLYFIAFVIFYQIGLFEPIINYRGVEGFSEGGTTFGISLIDKSTVEFLFAYLYSMVTQLFGLYFVNIQGVLAFLSESLLFIFCFTYVLMNRSRLSPLLTYLLVFFVVYNTVWLIGNDNLGTAVRLRVFSYLSIYLSAAYIFFQKRYTPVSVSC